MIIETSLDRIHLYVSSSKFCQVFTAFTRILLSIGFIPPSYKKIMHQPFTMLPDSNPVGHYFSALYQTGFYYEFIGWAQMIAAILLLIPRTSHLGAIIFLPIIVNIAVLTASVGFAGTWLVAVFMTFAAAWLVGWEYDRLKPLFFGARKEDTKTFRFQIILIPVFFAAGGIVMAFLWKLIGLGNFPNYFSVGVVLTIAGFLFGLIVALHYHFMRVGILR
ncbi:MAG: hypothetical protein WBD22_11445 [Pyrinomonadaceae bacterium]